MITAKSKVTCTFTAEIDISSGWSDDCTVAQIRRQSQDEANRLVEQLMLIRLTPKDYSIWCAE